MDDNVFGTPDVPDPPPGVAQLPALDPEEAARRRLNAQKNKVGREQLIIDQGVTGKGQQGTGLRIGG